MFDYLIVGAGFAGSVLAERLAAGSNKKVLICDKRPHIGGNAYDHYNDAGILVHKYGPHIFHTNSREVFEYLSRFTEWRPYQHRVRASVDGQIVPFPINLDTINSLYGLNLTSFEVEDFFKKLAEPCEQIRTSEDVVISKVGRELYEKFFRNYSRKQWGLDPSELDASVTSRVPTRTNRDDRYFTDMYQSMPLHGYTRMFERMLDHPNIKVLLNCDYRDVEKDIPFREMIYTGPVDTYFDYCYGKLPYRSLEFKHETHDQAVFQPAPVVNYPNEQSYTRVTEFKYLTGQEHTRTSIVYEFPKADGDPYYPVPRKENAAIYAKYQALANRTSGVTFVGRLATYKYYNMDQIVAQALTTYGKIAGMKRVEATAHRSENGNGNGHKPDADGVAISGLAMTAAGRQDTMTAKTLTDPSLEMWAGVECTVNRVGDTYSDQLDRSGHTIRSKDLERLTELGIRAVRYPILWERTAPEALDKVDWSWADERMEALQRLRLTPIVGLVHHGSGPLYTNLLDPEFPEKLAAFAGAVARRYSWVVDYTPVNEPLTTARFSCLYGHWYPHLRDPLMFARALFSQCRAIVLSMQVIRDVNPSARLIQTEDLGKTFSTPRLSYQAEFENERRWLTFDLLCGRVVPGTPMWDYFTWLGVERGELEWFLEHQISPDCLGINHYVTSERFLDERIVRYPAAFHGGNGRHVYADVEAVRVCSEGVAGPKAIMREAWERYHLPLAFTEVHLGCTREEQLRWLAEVWNAAVESRADNIDVRAVTTWAAFGAFDWDSLLTRSRGSYEPGAFDLRSPTPRATALSSFVKTLASGQSRDHPSLDAPGWWRRLDRLCYPPVARREPGVSSSVRAVSTSGESSRPLLITGATGTLGQAFARICGRRGLAYHLLSRAQLDISERNSVVAALDQYEPWAIINAAGYVRVDDAEREAEICHRDNVIGPGRLAKECALQKLPLVTFSSDLVFDGRKGVPYVESDATSPLNVYGLSKAAAEERVLQEFPEALVIRTSAFFGPWDSYNFVHSVLRDLSNGRAVYAAEDITISPTYVPDLVNTTLDLLIDDERGIWHLASPAAITWAGFAHLVANKAGYDKARIQHGSSVSLSFVAPRPSFTPLSSERGSFMPSLEDSLDRFFADRKWDRLRGAVSGRN